MRGGGKVATIHYLFAFMQKFVDYLNETGPNFEVIDIVLTQITEGDAEWYGLLFFFVLCAVLLCGVVCCVLLYCLLRCAVLCVIIHVLQVAGVHCGGRD